MSQFDKQLERIRTLDKNMRFEELRKVLEHFGYEMRGPSKGSSHMTFRKPGSVPITIPRHNKIDRVYVEMVREVVESEDHYEETGREDN